MSWDDADFFSNDPLVRYNAHQAAKGRPQMPDPDEVRKSQKESMTVPEYLESIGTDMNEMAEIQEKIERGEISIDGEDH